MHLTSDTADGPPPIFTPEYYARLRALEAESWWNDGMRRIAESILEDAGLPGRGLLLDAGCGSGQTMAWFGSGRPRWGSAGVDLHPDGLLAARMSGHRVVQGSVTDLPFRDSCADLVLTLDVLQHLPLDGGDVAALDEMRRTLRASGVLLVRTNAQAFPAVPDDAEFNFRRYTPETLRAALVSSGFDVLILGRVNAVLGLAEIPRELRARRGQSSSYHGILGDARKPAGRLGLLKRRWLTLEGKMLRSGRQLPFGRTMFAVCRPARRTAISGALK